MLLLQLDWPENAIEDAEVYVVDDRASCLGTLDLSGVILNTHLALLILSSYLDASESSLILPTAAASSKAIAIGSLIILGLHGQN